MTETEKKLLDEYCEANFNYELWADPLTADILKNYIFDSFGFKWYILRYYSLKLKMQIVDALKFWK